MRKTIMLGTLIALFGGGALAHAENAATTPATAIETARPAAARGEEFARERHHGSRGEHRETRHAGRDQHDENRDHRHESRKHGRHR